MAKTCDHAVMPSMQFEHRTRACYGYAVTYKIELVFIQFNSRFSLWLSA